MKRIIFIAVAVLGALAVSSCRKEVETIIERVKVQKGTLILSGVGAPDASLGGIGDYYLDLSTSDLYGSKTAEGWGAPMSLKGLQGDKGDKGDKGDTGATGAKGDKGDTGATGQKGSKGDTGATGTKGEKGDKGDMGATGAKGDKGDKGNTGATGPKGDKGNTDATGAKGDKGNTGTTGPKGDKGDTGATGAKGDKGDTGATGPKGDTGATGATGPKGETGATGATGPKGNEGAQGAPGQNGSRMYVGAGAPDNTIGAVGDWYIDAKNKRLYGPKQASGWKNEYIPLAVVTDIRDTDYTIEKKKGKDYLVWLNKGVRRIDMNSVPELKNTVIYLDQNSFFACKALESIVMGENVLSIEKKTFVHSYSIFKKLKTVVLNDKLTEIGAEAFAECTGLTTITIPKNVKTIGEDAFKECSNLKTFVIEAVTPPTIESSGSLFSNGKVPAIYVPAGSVDTYKAAAGWQEYASKIKEISELGN